MLVKIFRLRKKVRKFLLKINKTMKVIEMNAWDLLTPEERKKGKC